VFFITTGAHSDYHLPADDYWLLNYKAIKKILSYSFRLIMEVSNRDAALTFKTATSSKEDNTNVSYKVTLGIIPDMSSSNENGLGVDGVRENGPAAKGGIKKDDIITAIDGKPVKNIYEYMHRLNELELGKIISVEILRKGKKQILQIQL
jgi:S1-C subfamily serine protease